MDLSSLIKRHPRLSLALAGAGVILCASVAWKFFGEHEAEDDTIVEDTAAAHADPRSEQSQEDAVSVESSSSPKPDADLSKMSPPQLCNMLSSANQLEVLAALRGLMAQSTFNPLQDVTRKTGGLTQIARVAGNGPAGSRVLALEVLANYAPREENHDSIASSGVLDTVLQDLRRSISKNTSVIDAALGMSAARLLLNLASTNTGAQAVVTVDLLRILLDHAADRRSPLRLSSLKVLRNVSVATLPRESLLVFGSCVVRSPLGIESTTKLRMNATGGDECAALALAVLEKAKSARRAEGISQAVTPDHLASPPPPTPPPSSAGQPVSELELGGGRADYLAQEQEQPSGRMEQVEQRPTSPVSQAMTADIADDVSPPAGVAVQGEHNGQTVQPITSAEKHSSSEDRAPAQSTPAAPAVSPHAVRSASMMSPLSPQAVPLTAARRNRQALYESVSKALPSSYDVGAEEEGEEEALMPVKPRRELVYEPGRHAVSLPSAAAMDKDRNGGQPHYQEAGQRVVSSERTRTLSQTTPLVAATPGRQVTGVLPQSTRPPIGPASSASSAQAGPRDTPRTPARKASAPPSPSTSARSSPSGGRAASGTTPGRSARSALGGEGQAGGATRTPRSVGTPKAGQSVRQQVADKLKLGAGFY